MEKYYPYIQKVINFFRLDRVLEKDVATREMAETLYRRQNWRKILAEIWYKRIFMLLGAVFAAILFFVLCLSRTSPEDVITEGSYIRPGNRDKVAFEVQAQTEQGEAVEKITVDVRQEDDEVVETEEQEETPDQRTVILAEIQAAVEQAVSEQAGAEKIKLPEMVSGKSVIYRNPEVKTDFSAFYLAAAVVILLPFLWRRQQKELLAKRETQLMLDYPELVNKIMLLLSAGLTIRGCFERICREYEQRLGDGKERRYVYEEIGYSLQEMKNGVPEAEAIEAFGKRCRQISYLRLASVINQNIRKGAEGLTDLLEVEAMEAFEKRKEAVKVMGETAGTKLLLPMVLMLGVVMAIVIVPAFMTM